jgi:SAM-dependent methyltransferase
VDLVIAIFSLHEIRSLEERAVFMRNIAECLRPKGRIIIVEHRRDLANFFAYTIGFLHFLSAREWKTTFHNAGLQIEREIKLNPFVTCTVLTT